MIIVLTVTLCDHRIQILYATVSAKYDCIVLSIECRMNCELIMCIRPANFEQAKDGLSGTVLTHDPKYNCNFKMLRRLIVVVI